ncbi:MAG: hypothetical protein PHQ72_12560 [Hespellia sp.]|nr:hypothetical protein [Hespellia sp.]
MVISNILKTIYNYYPKISESTDEDKTLHRQKKISNKKGKNNKKLYGLRQIAEGYEVVDWTDDESCCYEYKILLHENVSIMDDDKVLIENLDGTRRDLRIFISVLEPYYYMFLEKTEYLKAEERWNFSTITMSRKKDARVIGKIDEYLSKNKYKKLTSNVVRTLVPDIETQYKECGEVIVFDCLFTDLVDIERNEIQC